MRIILIIAVVVIAAVAAWYYGLIPGMDGRGTDGMPAAGGPAPETELWRLGPDGKPAPVE